MSQQLSEQLALVFQIIWKIPGYGRDQTVPVWRTEIIFTIFDSFPRFNQHHFVSDEIHANIITHHRVPLTCGTVKHCTMPLELEDWKHWIDVSSLILLMISEISCKGKWKQKKKADRALQNWSTSGNGCQCSGINACHYFIQSFQYFMLNHQCYKISGIAGSHELTSSV